MSLRSCCYKDCENYSINNIPSGSFTLFQFPKDTVRRTKWMILGQVNLNIPQSNLFMCSDHFDRRKHLSVNPRRTILLGTAEPFPYNEKASIGSTENVIESNIHDAESVSTHPEATSYMYFGDDEVGVACDEDNKQVLQEQFLVESTIDDDETNILTYKDITIDDAGEDKTTNDYDHNSVLDANIVYNVREKVPHKVKKRKTTMESYVSESVQKVLNAKPTKEIILADGKSYNEKTLIDPLHISTFIYKGEEYLQMPKDYFLKDKLMLLHKVKNYENILRNMKQKLDVLNLD